MIRAFFGIDKNPFSLEDITLLPGQQDVFDILKVHASQGGLCLLLGEPGTGKSMIKRAITNQAGKNILVVHISRTLHTYGNTIKILCEAFKTDYSGSHFSCEKRLITEAFTLYNQGKTIIVIIDDAHLMDMTILRKLRLMFEDFPKNHNLILVGETVLLQNMALTVNQDITSRVTYSTILKKLNPDDMQAFIERELTTCGLPHNVFTENALALIVRSSNGLLRHARNISMSCLVEAIRAQKRTISTSMVNRVLIQPHFRIESDLEHFL